MKFSVELDDGDYRVLMFLTGLKVPRRRDYAGRGLEASLLRQKVLDAARAQALAERLLHNAG